MQDQTRACSLSLDDINVGLNSRQKEKTSSESKRQRKDGEGKGVAAETTPELESPVIENLHNRLLLTPIRWQSRSDTAAAAAASAAASYRRDSAPATLLMKEDAISRRCSNPALLETIEEGQVSCRRKSTPAVMVQGAAQRLRGGVHLSPRRTLNTIHSSSPPAPVRRRSMPEITTHKGTVTLETFYPPPRRNSLVTCSLAEVATRFELLNTRSQVPEESEMLERSRGFDRNNGSGVPPSSHNLPPITL